MNEKWGIIGRSERIQDVLKVIEQVADTDVAVLIQGESGTGKEMVTRAVHMNSGRSSQEMISVNCGAIPEGILESELFGHEKGSFTGAQARRMGYFEMADKSTIFLDEIGEMSLQTQVKLLRVLELGEFMRVGGNKLIKSDVRIIAATNKDLEHEVQKGNFRDDLFYRLKTVTIYLPSLRERTVDIPLFIDKFTKEIEKKYNLRSDGIDDEALDCLMHYEWPGNVRELKNLIESFIVLNKGRLITIENLPENIRKYRVHSPEALPIRLNKAPDQAERELIYGALLGLRSEVNEIKNMLMDVLMNQRTHPTGNQYNGHMDITDYIPNNRDIDDDLTVGKIETEAIKEALKRFGGNRRTAAKALGMSERTLYRKLKKL